MHKLPRIYIAANSGARIGFATDVKTRLNVVWKDSSNPIEMKYLSIDNEGPNDPVLQQVDTTLVDGNQRIDAVIGKEVIFVIHSALRTSNRDPILFFLVTNHF